MTLTASSHITSRLFDFGLNEAQEDRAARLHRECIIVDMAFRYAGSAVFSDLPDDIRVQLQRRLEGLREQSEILAEAIYWPFEVALQGKSDLIWQRFRASGITCGSYETILHTNHSAPDPLTWHWEEKLVRYTQLPWLRHVTTAAQIRDAKRDGVVALFANCQPIIPAPRNLDALDVAYSKGLRSFMLTYNRMDHIGVGCTERVDAGLSMYGVEVVRRCNELGMIVDVSHCGHLTTIDACRHSAVPITANHTAAHALHAHARGKSNEALSAIAATGGVIGVVAVPAFLTSDSAPTIDHMLDHVDHTVNLVGWKHVGIGTDWPWPVPREVLVAAVGDAHNRNAGFREQDRIDRTRWLNGFEDCRDWPNITRGLVKRGYGDEEIRGILGGNALRVIEEVCRG